MCRHKACPVCVEGTCADTVAPVVLDSSMPLILRSSYHNKLRAQAHQAAAETSRQYVKEGVGRRAGADQSLPLLLPLPFLVSASSRLTAKVRLLCVDGEWLVNCSRLFLVLVLIVLCTAGGQCIYNICLRTPGRVP